MSDTKLGQTPPADAGRDAVHVAIVAVVAGMNLYPGARVKLHNGEAVLLDPDDSIATTQIGVIDPFLFECGVNKGDRVWLCLKPGTVSNLRHAWAHPLFPDVERVDDPIAKSREWIENYASDLDIGVRSLMEYAEMNADNQARAREAGREPSYNDTEYLCQGGVLEGHSTSDEFWEHFAVVTGKKGSGNFFTCSC